MRPAGLLRRALHPGGFVLETLVRPVGLDIDRLDDALAGEVVEIFVDRIVAPDRLVGTEDARLHRADEPRQVGLAPDVVMRVDDAGHAALLCRSDSTWSTIAGGRSAVDHVVDETANRDQRLGLRHELAPTASGVSQLSAPGAPRKLGDRVAQRAEIAALEPVGHDTTAAPRA